MTVDLKQLMIILVLVALFILLIYMIILLRNAVPVIKQAGGLMNDLGRVSKIAADKTEKIDGVVNEITDTALNLSDTVRGNSSIVGMASNIGAGLASVNNLASKLRNDEEDAYLKRARERKAGKKK